MKPTIGRIVHFVAPGGKHLPAIVYDVHNEGVALEIFGGVTPRMQTAVRSTKERYRGRHLALAGEIRIKDSRSSVSFTKRGAADTNESRVPGQRRSKERRGW